MRVLAVNLVVLVVAPLLPTGDSGGDQYSSSGRHAMQMQLDVESMPQELHDESTCPDGTEHKLFSLQDGFGILTVAVKHTGSDGPVDVLVAQGAIVEFISSPYVDSPPAVAIASSTLPTSMPRRRHRRPHLLNVSLGPPFPSEIQVGRGSYPEGELDSDVRRRHVLSGDSPTDIAEVREMSTCTLTMLDSYGDGWNGDVWTGFNQEYTLEAPAPYYLVRLRW